MKCDYFLYLLMAKKKLSSKKSVSKKPSTTKSAEFKKKSAAAKKGWITRKQNEGNSKTMSKSRKTPSKTRRR